MRVKTLTPFEEGSFLVYISSVFIIIRSLIRSSRLLTMRSVALYLVVLAACVGANPRRLRREEAIVPLEPAKSGSSSLLELPEPGPIEESELVGEVPVTSKSSETADSLRGTPSTKEELPAAAASQLADDIATDTAAAVRLSTKPKQESAEEATTRTSSSTSSIFEVFPEQDTVEARLHFSFHNVCDESNAPGRSKIYCSGRLLASVNLHHIFPDSKTFVDRPIKVNQTEDEILADFESRFPPSSEIDPDQLRAFVEQHFEPEGHELEKCEVPDWQPSPPAFDRIADAQMREFAHKLNDIWKELCRKISPMVRDEPERFSLLHVPNNFIAPGGRFREFYYWDTYWIVKGLLASGMYETTRGMLENFGSIVERFGFIPNGGRVYYLKRSQPPLLTAMVYEYYEVTRNRTFLAEMLPLLEKEFDFWRENRSVSVDIGSVSHKMFQYRTPANVPRPESYREDASIASNFPSKGRQQQFYKDVGSAAESGWDFSTRWFADHKTLLNIRTTQVVPVDLNAFLCYNLNLMSFFHGELGNTNKERAWLNDFNSFKVSFRDVFYKPEGKGWYDYNLQERQHNTDFFPSIAIPLFTGCYDELSLTQSGDLLDRMAEMGALNLTGGIPTSLASHTQEQWDYPNGWSPLNHMVIEGMRKSGNPRLQQEAFKLAQRWVRSNLHVYNLDHAMWEKYNVVTNEARGGGGEYEVQAGFGWSNGVVLDLMLTYGDRLTAGDEPAAPSAAPSSAALEATTPAPSTPRSTRPNTSSASLSSTVSLLLVATVVASIANW
ncbi:tre-5 [Pristionchus pacificus]|uniref:Trehalase n=1 Tax=Pristionchus pacificus TaxID=54126 RepID=A0A2A6CEV2_PRIPA|nr:tre-5 [Pristionchus pacificus]|eukprot:PDM76659.1 tre-5 [Pristionchus pacificus]